MADLITALRNADAAGDVEAAQRIAAMIRAQQQPVLAPEAASPPIQQASAPVEQQLPSVNPDVPMGGTGVAFPARPEPVPPTIGERITGLGETALTMGTGATGGAAGFLIGGAQDIVNKLRGLPDKKMREEYADILTNTPDTEEGQKYVREIGKVLGVLPPVMGGAPMVGARTMAQSAKYRPAKTKASIISNIAKEIEEGNINAGNIAKTLDKNGLLIKNPNLKKAIKLMGNNDSAYSIAVSFEKMNNATRKQVNKMLKVIEDNKKSGDKSEVMENRPINVVGESLANRVNKLNDTKKKASASIGKIISGDSGKATVDTSATRDKFINALKESDISVGIDDNGKLVADTSRSLANTGDVLSDKKLNMILDRLQSGKMTAKEAHKIKRNTREMVSYDATVPGASKVSDEIQNTFKALSSDLGDDIGSKIPSYKKANEKFADSIGVLRDVDKMLGRNILIGDELAVSTLGDLSKRIGTNLISRNNTISIVKKLDEALNKRGFYPKDNIKQQVSAIDDLEKIFKIESEQAPFGIQSRFAQGVGEAALTGGVSLKADVVRGGARLLSDAFKPGFDSKMKALRALSKQKGDK